MIEKIFLLVKKFILGVLFIYAYNVIIFPLNMTIAFNLVTILLVTFFGFTAIIGLCLFSLFIF